MAKKANSTCSQTTIDLFWTGRKVWDNDGDEAKFENPLGTVLDRFAY